MGRTLDTLQIFDDLKEAFSEEQAHTLSKVIKEVQEARLEELATKRDLVELELRLKHDLTLRLGAMLAAGIAIVATLVKLL